MIILDTTTRSLEFKLSGAPSTNQIPFTSFYVDHTTSAYTPGSSNGVSNSTTAVTILSAPSASTQRSLKFCNIRNRDTAAVTITIQYNDNGTIREMLVVVLAVNDTLMFTDLNAWEVIDTNGQKKSSVISNAGTNLNTSALALESTQLTTNTNIGIVTETAPATDTASSGLNGRLQRLAQRITSLIALLPSALISNRLDVNIGAAPATISITHNKTIKFVSGSLTADTDIIAAVSTKRIKVIGYSLTSSGVNANTVIFKSNGTSGTELWRLLLQSSASISAGANLATSAPSFLFATVAGEKLTLDVSQTDTIHYSIAYFDDDIA